METGKLTERPVSVARRCRSGTLWLKSKRCVSEEDLLDMISRLTQQVESVFQ